MQNFVYLAQRHSQEFSCEPNFGGGVPPLAAPVSSEGNFYNRFTANLPGNLSVKKLCKSVKIWQNYGHEFVAYFLSHAVLAQKTPYVVTPDIGTIRYEMLF